MSAPDIPCIRTSYDSGVAVISYDVPPANTLWMDVSQGLIQAFTWALHEPKVKVVVLTGEGKFFSAGLRLSEVPETGPVLPDEEVELLRETHKIWINAEKVLIAAVNGPAVGYGTSSIALFDLVYSVPDAVFFTPFAKLGLCAEACASVTFRNAMGRQKASSLILAGDQFTASELENAGLITKILPKESFMDEVMKIAKRVAAYPAGSLLENKRLLMAPLKEELLAANERECDGLKRRAATDEPRKAIENFQREQAAKKKKSAKL